MKNVTFRHLRVFTEVARHMSFVRAAQALHITPPAVTMQVKELESLVDLPLFDRRGRTVALTTAGEYFIVYARRLLGTLKEADDAMARFRKLETGLLTVGMVSTAKYFVPRLLALFRQDHPGIDVRLSVCQNRDQLVAAMYANEVDLSIMGRPPKELACRSEAVAAHPLVFAAPSGHPVLRDDQPLLDALAPYPLLIREPGSGTRAAMEQFFAERRFEPRTVLEMSSNETIKQAVMAGMGLTFLSLHTMGLELKSNLMQIVHVQGTPLMRTWNVVYLMSRVLSPAAEAFRYFVIEHAENWLAEHDRPWLGTAVVNAPAPTATA